MAYSTHIVGPEIVSSGPSGSYPSGTYSFEVWRENNTSKRTKPRGVSLLSMQTPYFVRADKIVRSETFSSSSASSTSGPSEFQTAPFDPASTTVAVARRATTAKLLAKIKGEDWNLGTFIGELPETLKYFSETLRTLMRTYRAVRRGDMREVRKMRKQRRETNRPPVTFEQLQSEVSGRWLEWRYAIQPLMYDLDDALKALYNSRARAVWTRVASGEPFLEGSKRAVGSIGKTIYAHKSCSGQLRQGVYFQVKPKVDAFKRLGLLNPVATLWELFPLSFVVDWFIPIGEYLGSLDAMAGVSILSSWESQSFSSESVFLGDSFTSKSTPEFPAVTTTVTGSRSTRRLYSRTVNPSLKLSLPVPQLSLNTSRFLDGLALSRVILLSGK